MRTQLAKDVVVIAFAEEVEIEGGEHGELGSF
jgi:hypothetical protein